MNPIREVRNLVVQGIRDNGGCFADFCWGLLLFTNLDRLVLDEAESSIEDHSSDAATELVTDIHMRLGWHDRGMK